MKQWTVSTDEYVRQEESLPYIYNIKKVFRWQIYKEETSDERVKNKKIIDKIKLKLESDINIKEKISG